MAQLGFDMVEQILVRLDVEDLIRCKRVSKSWQSLISAPRFVKAHLNLAYTTDRDNHQLGHRRVCLPDIVSEDSLFHLDCIHIVGSCNGLLCVSLKGVKFLVTNPSTRERRKLPTPPFRAHMLEKFSSMRQVVIWGFGYDSSADNYKVVAAFQKKDGLEPTHFHVFSLNSNTWKAVGQIKYSIGYRRTGVLCDGALHWFMTYKNPWEVIVSFDLSTHEFKEIPPPDADILYNCNAIDHALGVLEECLCIYTSGSSTKKWVLKNNKWELYIDDYCQSKYDIAHNLGHPQMASGCSVDDGTRVPVNGIYIRASIFVKSLVSPHPHVNFNNNHYEGQTKEGWEVTESVESGAKGKIRKRDGKRSKRSFKHKKRLVWM